MNITILKYISYAFSAYFVFSNAVFWSEAFPIGFLAFLGWLAISQYRANYISTRGKLFFGTIVVESVIGMFLFYRYGGFYSVFLMPVILDIVLTEKKISSYFPVGLIAAGLPLMYWVQVNQKENLQVFIPNVIISDLFILTVIVTFSIFLAKELGRKRLAQRLYDQLRVSEEKLQEAYETLENYSQTIEELTLLRERTRISRELHDSVGHALSTTSIQLRAIKTLIGKDPEKAAVMIEHLSAYSHDALDNVRRTVQQLRPIEFEHYEGIFAIEELIKTFRKLTGVDVRLIVSKVSYPMNSDQSHQLYRIIQECLSNSLRHGKASMIQVSIQFLSDSIYSQIKDNGQGCTQIQYGMGISGIKERVDSLKGEMNIYTKRDQGFEVTIKLPRRISEASI
ncbi:MAG: sensor histidine kinase [Thermotogota bacterium]